MPTPSLCHCCAKEGSEYSSACTPGTVPRLSLHLGVPSSHIFRLRILLSHWESCMAMLAGWIYSRGFLCRIRGCLHGPE